MGFLDQRKKMDCCFSAYTENIIIFASKSECVMSYELIDKETITATKSEGVVSQIELEKDCYTLEESKKLLLAKVHNHFHPKKA